MLTSARLVVPRIINVFPIFIARAGHFGGALKCQISIVCEQHLADAARQKMTIQSQLLFSRESASSGQRAQLCEFVCATGSSVTVSIHLSGLLSIAKAT